jgi:predicted metal-dependent peptidase
VLRRLLARATMPLPKPSPLRPARRWIATASEAARRGTPVPGFEPGRAPLTDVPRIAVALDASGSIDAARLALFWGEVTGIARRMRAELHLMIFDDGIRHRVRIDPTETRPALPEMPRDGGTDFAAPLAEAAAMGASVLVMLTDLDGEPGMPPKGLPVIWAVPDGAGVTAPFGRVLDLSA